jgi:hypothetical protein
MEDEHEHVAVTVFDSNGRWIDTNVVCTHCNSFTVNPPYGGYVTVLDAPESIN